MHDRYAQPIFNYCLRRLRSREEAEDAAQIVFLNAHRCLEEGVDPQSERAWLFKIAEHVVMYRRRTISRRARVEFPIDVDSLADLVVAPGHEIPVELDGLPDALARIPDAQRRAIVLREWYGLSYREVADELGLSASAAETLIFRARRRLAQELGGPAPTEKRRRPLGLASPVAALKWLLGGGTTLKALVGVSSVAVIAVGSTRVGPFVHPATRPAAAAPLSTVAVRAVAAPHHVVRLRAPARGVVHVRLRPVRVRVAHRPSHAAASQAPVAELVDPAPTAAAPDQPAPAATTDPVDSQVVPAPAETAPRTPDAPIPTADRLEAAVASVPPPQPDALSVPDVPVGPPPVADPGEPVGTPPQDQGQGTPGPSEMASFGQGQRSEHASPSAADPGNNGQGAGQQNGSTGNGDAIPEPATDGAPDGSELPAATGGGPPPQAQGDPAPGRVGRGQPSPATGPRNGNGNGNGNGKPGQDASDVEAPAAV
jgi:RNA polymerase sigma factor (sigma-70 family)